VVAQQGQIMTIIAFLFGVWVGSLIGHEWYTP
jgi:hypothetical protein